MKTLRRRWMVGCAAGVGLAHLPLLGETMKGHVVLLGDSILDNKAYVGNGPAVIDQVKQVMGADWQATLLAVDGSRTGDVLQQIEQIPSSATHLIISSGGNDALWNQAILQEEVSIALEAFQKLAALQLRFGKEYETMLNAAKKKVPSVAVCTIYDPNFNELLRQQVSVAALSVFNDRITRNAFQQGLPVIDLRSLFREKADYANPIEPSSQGGMKIAKVIRRIVLQHDFADKQTRIYGGTRDEVQP